MSVRTPSYSCLVATLPRCIRVAYTLYTDGRGRGRGLRRTRLLTHARVCQGLLLRSQNGAG